MLKVAAVSKAVCSMYLYSDGQDRYKLVVVKYERLVGKYCTVG